MLKPFVAFLLLSVPSVAVTAQSTSQPTSQPASHSVRWTLASGSEGCLVHSASPKGTVLSILANPGQEGLGFLIQNRQWTSLQDGQRYALELEFDDMGEWEIQAVARQNLDEDGPGLLFAIPAGREDGAKFMKEFAAAGGIHVGRDGRVLDSLSLAGAQGAMSQLAQCLGQQLSTQAGATRGSEEPAFESEDGTQAVPI